MKVTPPSSSMKGSVGVIFAYVMIVSLILLLSFKENISYKFVTAQTLVNV